MLNEALAKKGERNVRRTEDVGSTAGKLAVPQELQDMPIPPDSDPRRRRAMKAATVAANSCSLQMEGSRAVAQAPTQQKSMADGSIMDVEGGFEGTEHHTSTEESRKKHHCKRTKVTRQRWQ